MSYLLETPLTGGALEQPAFNRGVFFLFYNICCCQYYFYNTLHYFLRGEKHSQISKPLRHYLLNNSIMQRQL